MTIDTSFPTRSHEENWLPVLELSVEEVFEIMLGSRIKPAPRGERPVNCEFTAMVGLAGSLCGIISFSCARETARQVATCMIGPEIADSPQQVSDALGEICNMIAGNFKNKLAGTDGSCMLSVPTVIEGGEYSFRSLAEGQSFETTLAFNDSLIVVNLQLHA